MQRKWLFGLTGAMMTLTAMLVLFVGCGGGGGPILGPETGGGPSPSAQFLELLPAAQRNATYVGSATCGQSAACHQNTQHATWKDTRHAQVNVGCENCHGGGSVHAANPRKDNILTFPSVSEAVVCGQCHGPTFEQWKQSRHAGVVDTVIEEGASNPEFYVRTCFRCHSSVFRMEMMDVELAEGKTPDEIHNDIQATPKEELLEFVHVSHSSAGCGNCHDPHKKTGILTSTGNEAQLRRLTFVSPNDAAALQSIDPGSPVKEYTTFNHICASCHNARGGNPADGALTTGTARPNMHDSNQFNMLIGMSGVEGTGPIIRRGAHTETPDQCVYCHLPDRRHTFTVSLDRSCQPCHTAADAASRSAVVRSEFLNNLLALRTRLENWAQQAFGDPTLWNYTALIAEEGGTPPDQSQVPIEIKRARHNYYFVLRDKSFGIHNTPYARHLMNVAHEQLDALGISRAHSRTSLTDAQKRAILQLDLRLAKAADAHER